MVCTVVSEVGQAFLGIDSFLSSTSGEPKFPTPVTLHFLFIYARVGRLSSEQLRQWTSEQTEPTVIQKLAETLGLKEGVTSMRERHELAEERTQRCVNAQVMACHTLDKIASGGIHDHVGGGFHRYSTDYRWHVYATRGKDRGSVVLTK